MRALIATTALSLAVSGCAALSGPVQPGNPPIQRPPIVGTILDSAGNAVTLYARIKRCRTFYEKLAKIDTAAVEGLLTRFEQDTYAPGIRDRGAASCSASATPDDALALEAEISLADALINDTNRRRRQRAG
ncbi:MAG: hypothetical protein AAFR79_11680 [Pseudomonadota bacterium]